MKTESQFSEMDISAEAKRAVSALFGEPEEEIQKISELPGIPQRLVEILEKDNIADIESLVALTPEQLAALEGITAEDIQTIHKIIEENVEIVEEEPAAAAEEEAAARRPRRRRRRPGGRSRRAEAQEPEAPRLKRRRGRGCCRRSAACRRHAEARGGDRARKKRTSVRSAARPSRPTWPLVQTAASV